ncbi:MAG: acetyltransferase, partial [Ferruginibacter sp.]
VIGYSGHAFVVLGILQAMGKTVSGYCDVEEKAFNPFNLPYIGAETAAASLALLQQHDFFIAVGDNQIRKKVYAEQAAKNLYPVNAVHPSAVIDASVTMAKHAVMIAANVTINPLASVGIGAICNTGCVIEHECIIGDFAHIGPGAVLCGNVKIANAAFVGAGAVIKQGISIGENAVIGAGAVVVKDVQDNVTVVGVPAK